MLPYLDFLHGYLGGPRPIGEGRKLQKIGSRRDLKLQIFGAEDAENFEKSQGF